MRSKKSAESGHANYALKGYALTISKHKKIKLYKNRRFPNLLYRSNNNNKVNVFKERSFN